MKLAVCLFRYFPYGGMQRDMLATVRQLQRRGHDVRVYCHTFDAAVPADLDVELVPARGRTNHGRAASFADGLQQRLAGRRADAVIGFDKMPGLDFYFAADPCYVTRTERRPWPYRRTRRYRTMRRLEGSVFAADQRTRVLLLDERERTNYQRAWQTPDERFTLLPPGIARDRCRGPDADERRRRTRAELGIADEQRLLLLLAANYRLKGLDRAMRALANLPPELRARTRLLAVGGGEDPAMRRLASRLGLAANVMLLKGRDDVGSLLQAADALVHPARSDNTGTVLLEAVVAGLPVVCSAVCGYASYVADACCGIVLPEPFEQGACDRAVRELLAADQQVRRHAALAFAASHDLHGMHEKIVRVVETGER